MSPDKPQFEDGNIINAQRLQAILTGAFMLSKNTPSAMDPVVELVRDSNDAPERHSVSTGVKLERRLNILSPAYDYERNAFFEKHNNKGYAEEDVDIFRHMGTLYFGDVYTAGFAMDIFGKDIMTTMSKKINRIYLALSGSGVPYFAYQLVTQTPVHIARSKKEAK